MTGGTLKAKNVTIRVPPIHVNLSPLGFHYYAAQFLAVARSIESGPSFSPVPYYLYCRALELSLKAYLLAKGLSKKELKKKSLGHNLERILNRAEYYGLLSIVQVMDEERQELLKANNYYADKDFEYANVSKIVRGYPELPDMIILDRLAERLINELEPICLEA
jgi:hypothetical protein